MLDYARLCVDNTCIWVT